MRPLRHFSLAALASLASFAALVSSVSGCSRPSAAPEDAAVAPSTASPQAAAAPPRMAIEAGAARRRLNLTCRAMVVEGSPSIQVDGGVRPLAMNDLADGWVTLATPADSLTVTLPRTGRELRFVGPAVVEPCVGTDEAWLLRGRFEGSRGSGESPGAEQWVVTPFGVVRYGAAIVEVDVEDTRVRTSLKGGSATLLPEGATTWESLTVTAADAGSAGKLPKVVKGAPLGAGGSAASADRCAKASAASRALQDALTVPGAAASPTFGDLAMRANDANVLARAACAVAKLRAGPRD